MGGIAQLNAIAWRAQAYDRWAQNALNGGWSSSLSFNTATNRINSSGYAYDAAGNLTNDGQHSYTVDAQT